MFALSLDKIDKYECLIGAEIWPSQEHRIIEGAKFTFSSKRVEKQTKTIEKQEKKQRKAIEEKGDNN